MSTGLKIVEKKDPIEKRVWTFGQILILWHEITTLLMTSGGQLRNLFTSDVHFQSSPHHASDTQDGQMKRRGIWATLVSWCFVIVVAPPVQSVSMAKSARGIRWEFAVLQWKFHATWCVNWLPLQCGSCVPQVVAEIGAPLPLIPSLCLWSTSKTDFRSRCWLSMCLK